MPQKKQVMEFKIQVSYDGGKIWFDTIYHSLDESFKSTKELCDLCRKENTKIKYRIVGRELMPWCEIKED